MSVVDFTHGRALLRLTTDQAAGVLEKMCSLDLGDTMTPDGAVVSASVAKVSCDVIRDDVDGTRSYLIACDRSFGDYLIGAMVVLSTRARIIRLHRNRVTMSCSAD